MCQTGSCTESARDQTEREREIVLAPKPAKALDLLLDSQSYIEGSSRNPKKYVEKNPIP